MPRVLPTLARWSALGGVIWAIAILSPTVAQQGDAKKGAPKSTLAILVQVKNQDVNGKELEDTLSEGAEKLGYTFDSINAVPLRPETLAEIQKLISRLEAPRPGGNLAIIRQRTGDAVIEWEFNLNVDEPGVVLRKLELKSKKGEKEETKTIELTSVSKPDDPIIRTPIPGVYLVRLKPNETPVAYTAHYQSTKARDGKSISGPWPAAERCFMLSIRNFQGDQKKLLDFVRRQPKGQKQNVANPIDDIEPGPDITMVFAAIGFQHVRSGGTLDQNRWIPVVQPIDLTDTDRVWMLFPLSEEQADKKLQEISKLDPSPKGLSKLVRDTNPKWAEKNPMITIHAEMDPTWIELPAAGKGFSRELQLKDVRALQKSYPVAYRLIIYEKGTIQNSSAQYSYVEGRRVFVFKEAVSEWPEGIKKAAAGVKK